MLTQSDLATHATHFAMGTVMSHMAFGQHVEEGLAAVCSEIARIEGRLSRFLPGSEISRINESAGIRSVKVNPETLRLLCKAVDFSRRCAGCFDISIAPLVALWKQAAETLTPPDEADIDALLPLVSYQDLELDGWELTAGLRTMGQALDLGGIGKGYTAQRIRQVYRDFGIMSAYSNLGGNVLTLGSKPDGTPWQVGIRHPRIEQCLLGSVAVSGESVVTSGDYQRCFIDRQGIRQHHILDPRSGHPSHSGLSSVTIVTPHDLAADVLSTAVFVAGLQAGLEILGQFPQSEAVLVSDDLQVFITPGLKDRFRAEKDIEAIIL